jgi:hypothetical protein
MQQSVDRVVCVSTNEMQVRMQQSADRVVCFNIHRPDVQALAGHCQAAAQHWKLVLEQYQRRDKALRIQGLQANGQAPTVQPKLSSSNGV